MRIAGVEFPEPLLTALRDGRLVVFAGAGVSMAAPAGLPDFRGLAHRISQGTNISIGEEEREDRFLYRLKTAELEIHPRASKLLQQGNPQPTELHRNILRLYRNADDVRIVTTNFDMLFEQAAIYLYNPQPQSFQAPALPLGHRFQGIVHIHGAVDNPQEMILTSEDFGRAYLTEADGWARRFLVDLFANAVTLFVGYSHNDTIMNYLTQSLARHDSNRQYALIGAEIDTPSRWQIMGVQPITFPQENKGDYSQLDKAIADLAKHFHRGFLDWQREITNIATGMPPSDKESADIIDHALSEPRLTRFFTAAAQLPGWIDWLDHRNHFSALFADGTLSEQQLILAEWLVRQFAVTHPDFLFSVIRHHGAKLNPILWNILVGQLKPIEKGTPDPNIPSRWVLFLTINIPTQVDSFALLRMAEVCAETGMFDSLLQVYDAIMARINRSLAVGMQRHSPPSYESHAISQLNERCLRPNLHAIAESLLARTSTRIEERYLMLKAWNKSDDAWHLDWRPAIEPHQQNNNDQACDHLIEVARDCLEWLATNQPYVVQQWSEHHIDSPVALLRRLAIHTLTIRTDLSANSKITLLLEHCDIHDIVIRHEVFRAARAAYPQCDPEHRKYFVEAILSYRQPLVDELDNELQSAYQHFNWLHWLNEADPNDDITADALAEIRDKYPDLRPREHPDFISYFTISDGSLWNKPSPWTVSEMLESTIPEWLPLALAHQSQNPTDIVRDELSSNIVEATQQQPSWGISLATEMAKNNHWDTPLWNAVIEGFSTDTMDENTLENAVAVLSNANLYKTHGKTLARTIYGITKTNYSTINPTTLAMLDEMAKNLWEYAQTEDQEDPDDWMFRAINHPSGILAQYWVQSIARWHELQPTHPKELSCNDALSKIMADQQMSGVLARVVFTRDLPFLSLVGEDWVERNLIPLLSPDSKEFEAAWDGLSYCGRIYPQTAELLRKPSLEAVEHISNTNKDGLRHRFVRLYTELLTWFAECPTDEWIVNIISHGSTEIRCLFANNLQHIIRASDESKQKELWNTWLKEYWENRLSSCPVKLDDEEIRDMLNWPNELKAVYPDAVELAVRMQPVHIETGTPLYRLINSDLPTEHPESVAKFLIHIGKIVQPQEIWYQADKIVDLLIQSGISKETEANLKELKAKIGL